MATAQDNLRALPRSAPLSAARLFAVQALYQMDMTGVDLNRVIEEFVEHRLVQRHDDGQIGPADGDFFVDLVRGVVRGQRTIDPVLHGQLADGWRLSRIDSTLRAILRSAAYELLERPDIPARVVITEYLEVAHAFLDADVSRAVNGILDALARKTREDEFAVSNNA